MVVRANRTESGFTLIELMIVVAIIGVLASLALYGVSRYIRHSKTAEATRNLGTIEDGERVQYQQETPYGTTSAGATTFVHMFCPPDGPTPASVPQGSKIKVPPGSYNTTGWACTKFAINDPQFYSYTVTTNSGSGTGASYTALANGDLNGDGLQSTFYVSGVGGMLGDAARVSLVVINEDE